MFAYITKDKTGMYYSHVFMATNEVCNKFMRSPCHNYNWFSRCQGDSRGDPHDDRTGIRNSLSEGTEGTDQGYSAQKL